MHAVKVKTLYRKFLRAALCVADVDLQSGLKTQIKQDFRRCSALKDKVAIKSCLIDAERQLNTLNTMTVTATVGNKVRHDDAAGAGRRSGNLSSQKKGESDGGSWLDDSDLEDKRGRVGEGWPWNKTVT